MLNGKIVLVTGGASGIGRAICLAAAAASAALVIVTDIEEQPREGGPTTCDLIRRAGGNAVYRRLDVSDPEAVDAVMAFAAEQGGLDLVVCNAGVALPGDTLEISQADYRRLTAVNFDGAAFTALAAARQMARTGKAGSIVLISSMGGIRGSAATLVYSATKGALRLLAASLADSVGPSGVRVNAVCPGVIETELASAQGPAFKSAMSGMIARTPLRRSGQPKEVAALVVWLGSDQASFISGASIPVDGGLSAVL